MTADEWQACVTREAAKEIGRWLEGRGRLAAPVSALTLADLEAMASVAISRFILLGSDRIRARPEDDEDLQVAENILPAVHTESLTDDIRAALDSVSEVLTTEALQEMNVQVDVDRMDPQDVATQFLQDNGLL